MNLNKIQVSVFFTLLFLSMSSLNISASLCGTECGNLSYKQQLFELKKQEIRDSGIFELSFALAGGLDVIANTPFQPGCQGSGACVAAVIVVKVAAAIMSHNDKIERESLAQFAGGRPGSVIALTIETGTLAISFDTDLVYGSIELQETLIIVQEAPGAPDIIAPGTLAIFPLVTPANFDGAQLANIDSVVSFSSYHEELEPVPTSYVLNVRKIGNGSGLIKSSSLDINCGTDCIENYTSNANAQIILSASPDDGSVFRGWNGACSGTGACTMTMYGDKNITATFALATPATFNVSNLDDNTAGSLRQAINSANDNPGDDIITFSNQLTGTIMLTNGQLIITDSVDVNGPGADRLAISGNHTSRVFQIKPGTNRVVSINGLMLKDGRDNTGNGGGAIITESGTISIRDCAIINNVADSGGGGGGLRKFGPGVVTIINTLFSGNNALDGFQQGAGGGISIDNENLTLINSTVSDNKAANGGGIASNEGTLEVNNSTITGNSALNFGGGIDSNNTTVLANSMVVGNDAPLESEISFFSVDGHPFISRGHNIFGESGVSGITQGLILARTDSILVAPLNKLIEPLADNAGATLTHLPVEGGLAIDHGDNSLIPQGVNTDQRREGFPRINNGIVDIGAVESVKQVVLDTPGSFRFTYNGHTYDVITMQKNWSDAVISAGLKNLQGKSGYLVHIDNESENQKIVNELKEHFSGKNLAPTFTFDGGLQLEALWIGANDLDNEGAWVWQDDSTQFWQGSASGHETHGLYSNWGKGNTGNEPNDYSGEDLGGQNTGVIRLTDWVFGGLGEWDDVSANNSLFYIVEYDDIEGQANAALYKNGILEIPSVFVAEGNGCYLNYAAKLAIVPGFSTTSFSLNETSLLAESNCDIKDSNRALFENGILKLPNVEVFDDFNNSVSYNVEFLLEPLSNPLIFKLLRAQ